jgi:plasmid maintenance system antidote protein VapI
MKKNSEFMKYIDWCGSVKNAALRLKRTDSSLYHVINGYRQITKELAKAIDKDSKGRYKKEKLIWEE